MFGMSVPSDVDEESKELRIPRFGPSSGPPAYLVSGEDIVYIKPKLWNLAAQPYPWDVSADDPILINPAAALSGLGATLLPLKFVSDGEVLIPDGPQILYSKFGSYESPAVTITLASGENAFFTDNSLLKIPLFLIYLGMGIRIQFIGYKPDADAGKTYFRVRLGSSAVFNNNDQYFQLETAAAAKSQIPIDFVVRVAALGAEGTAIFSSSSVSPLFTSSFAGAGVAGDRKTKASTIADQYVSITTLGNTGSQSALVNYSISLVP